MKSLFKRFPVFVSDFTCGNLTLFLLVFHFLDKYFQVDKCVLMMHKCSYFLSKIQEFFET